MSCHHDIRKRGEDAVKVLFLTRYDEAGASSRYRCYQYLPFLRTSGIEVEVMPLLRERYLDAKYAGRRSNIARIIAAFVHRAFQLIRARRFDVVWIEKELFPWLPGAVDETLAGLGRVPIVVDLDDAIFHNYDMHPRAAIRNVLGRKIDRLMASATVVIAGNRYLAERSIAAGARRTEIVPTVIDLARYPYTSRADPGECVSIAWIGTPVTERYLTNMVPILREVCADGRAQLVTIGTSSSFDLPGVPHRKVAWAQATEAEAIAACDIGIMPIPDEPWSLGKCGLKLIQYMGCGLPVVASAVGANNDIVIHGENGFLCTSHHEWVSGLKRLVSEPALRFKMGSAGRIRVERQYSLQNAGPRIVRILEEASRSSHDAIVSRSSH